MIRIQSQEQKVWADYIYDISGIFLDASKAYLFESRFAELLKSEKCANFSELFFKTKADSTKILRRKVIDAITTGETLFFRDSSPFDLFQHKLIPDLIDRRTRQLGHSVRIPIRIWSAACSTGQEVYTIGMVLKSLLGNFDRYNIQLLGTDISDKAIAYASRGLFNKIEIERGLSKDKLARYFTSQGEFWKISDEIRSLATFRTHNLLDDNYSSLGRFDIILCRNVTIYFKEKDKIQVFQKIGHVLDPDGYLIIGSTESIMGYCPQFESKRYLRSVFYQLK